MSDCEETDDSCGEEQSVTEWEVTKEWLQTILTEWHREPVAVSSFDVSPGCTTNQSILSAIIRVTGNYVLTQKEQPRDLSIIVKQLPKDPFSRFFVTEGQFDLREIKFYTQIIPDLRAFQRRQLSSEQEEIVLPVPTCFHGHYSPAGGTEDSPIPPESILVLEDLHSSNFRGAEFSRGLTLEQAELALGSIARIHAHSLAMKVIDGQPLSERYPFLFQTTRATDSYQQLVERGLPQLARFLESRPGLEVLLEALMGLRPKISAMLAPEGPLALITHTDFWCNNLLFKADASGLECRILDWQMVTYSRPTNDIALLLLSSVPTELRRKHTESFLDVYWNALTGTCVLLGLDIPKDLGYTRQDLDKDYRRSQILALLLCIGSVDLALGDPLIEQRLIDVLQDLHSDGVLADEASASSNDADP